MHVDFCGEYSPFLIWHYIMGCTESVFLVDPFFDQVIRLKFLISASILNAIYFRSQLEILNSWKEMESKSLASTTTTTACTLPSSSIRPITGLTTASHSMGSTLSPTISPISPIKTNLSPITGLRNEMLNSLNTVASVYQRQEPKFNFHKLAESATKDKIKKKTRPKKEYICRWLLSY